MFALIELLRGVTAFPVAPILLFLVVPLVGGDRAAGIQDAVWICLGIAVAGGLAAAAVFVVGGGRLQAPDLARWQEQPAWESRPLTAAVGGSRSRPSGSGSAGGAGAGDRRSGVGAPGLTGAPAAFLGVRWHNVARGG